MARRRRRRRKPRASDRGGQPFVPQPLAESDFSALEGAQWLPPLGGTMGLCVGGVLASWMSRATPNALAAFGWMILGAIGGGIGGIYLGCAYQAHVYRSMTKRNRRT